MSETITVNNYEAKRYDEHEVEIQTTAKKLEANNGKVYLTTVELEKLLKLATGHEVLRLDERTKMVLHIALSHLLSNVDEANENFAVYDKEDNMIEGSVNFNGKIQPAITEDEINRMLPLFD